MHSHAHYKELCGLASTGQLPEEDAAGFKEHLRECSECRSQLQDFVAIGLCLVRTEAEKQQPGNVPPGMTERFLARARSEGIPILHSPLPRKRPVLAGWKPVAAAGLVAPLLFTALFVFSRVQPAPDKNRNAQAAPSAAAPRIAPAAASRDDLRDSQLETLQRELHAARADANTLTARWSAGQNALDKQRQELEALKDAAHRLEVENAALNEGSRDHAAKVARLEGEIEKLESIRKASDIALLTEENELRGLRQSLLDKEASVKKLQHLVEVGSQVRDLITARNFHVFDVTDYDGDGRQKRAFGRIFYTEGKSLIFYAYDLGDPRKVEREISFYVWGAKLGHDQPVKRLGVFHNESVNEGRWVLTFDDPRVLAQIDSVFVTAEAPKKPVTEPTGERFLNAFLRTDSNHP